MIRKPVTVISDVEPEIVDLRQRVAKLEKNESRIIELEKHIKLLYHMLQKSSRNQLATAANIGSSLNDVNRQFRKLPKG